MQAGFIIFTTISSRKTPLELVRDKLTFMGEKRSDTHYGRIRNKFIEIEELLIVAMSDAKTIVSKEPIII